MRKKRFDLCQVFMCQLPTASGEREYGLERRYCYRHMPENVERKKEEFTRGKMLKGKCRVARGPKCSGGWTSRFECGVLISFLLSRALCHDPDIHFRRPRCRPKGVRTRAQLVLPGVVGRCLVCSENAYGGYVCHSCQVDRIARGEVL